MLQRIMIRCFIQNRYAIADTMRINYTSPYEGTIQEICVSNGDYVQKGDVLLKVRTNEGSAKLAEMRSGIEDMKENRTKAVQAHEIHFSRCNRKSRQR